MSTAAAAARQLLWGMGGGSTLGGELIRAVLLLRPVPVLMQLRCTAHSSLLYPWLLFWSSISTDCVDERKMTMVGSTAPADKPQLRRSKVAKSH